MDYALGIDVGGTKVAYALYDGERRAILSGRVPADASAGPDEFFEGIAALAERALIAAEVPRGRLRGVGLAMPSYIRQDEGYILKTSNLPRIRDFPAAAFLRGLLPGVRVALVNDAQAAALAESRYGAGRGHRHMLYCPVSTGISSAIVIDGKLFQGSYGFAGETGHMIATPGEGEECGCGNRGCYMSYCSGGMIVRHIRRWIAEGDATVMAELAGGADFITAEHLLAACDLGDNMARRAVDQMARYMAAWLYNVYLTLNIDRFVFGGGLINFGDRLFGPVRAQFDAYNQSALPVTFATAELSDPCALGAAELLSQ